MKKLKPKASDPMLDKIILTAQLYYNNHFSQQEIADRLHISRPWVSKLLNKAQEMGFVKISIDTPISGIPSIEERLKERYPVSLIRVVKAPDQNHNYVALSAANYFVSQVQNNDTIGIGWGNAISQFIQELTPLSTKNVKVIPMAGSFGATFETLPNYSAIELAKKNQRRSPNFACTGLLQLERGIRNISRKRICSYSFRPGCPRRYRNCGYRILCRLIFDTI